MAIVTDGAGWRRAGVAMASLVALLFLAGGATAARRPAAVGVLDLDIADPVITAHVAGRPLRLRVDFDQRDVVELNRAAADALGLPFEEGPDDLVGRVDAPSRVAPATLTMNKRETPVTLSTHGDCCAGVDGAIGPDLLPFAEVRFRRAGATSGEIRELAMVRSSGQGLYIVAPAGRGAVRLQLALGRGESLGAAAAGAILARAAGGRFVGGYAPAPVAFGASRPSRVMAYAAPPLLAGFRFATLRIRTADYSGGLELPRDPAGPDDIVVRRRVRPQGAWPLVQIGRDRLDACSEIRFQPRTLRLSLTCRFDG